MNIFSSFMVTIRFESEKTIKTKSFVEMNIVIYTETQCRAVTLEFGAETTPLLCGFELKIEISKLYRPFINKFNSIILCSHP